MTFVLIFRAELPEAGQALAKGRVDRREGFGLTSGRERARVAGSHHLGADYDRVLGAQAEALEDLEFEQPWTGRMASDWWQLHMRSSA